MLQYWLPDRGTPESFWAHEWNKHGTCVNTLSPSCYASESTTSHDSFDSTKQSAELKRRSLDEGYKHGQEVVDYLLTAISLFDRLDTYTALTNAGIYPSKTRHYTHREVSAALEKVTGKPVILGCKRGELNEVWYTFNVRGSLQGGVFEAADPAGAGGKGTCGRNVRWLPKV